MRGDKGDKGESGDQGPPGNEGPVGYSGSKGILGSEIGRVGFIIHIVFAPNSLPRMSKTK